MESVYFPNMMYDIMEMSRRQFSPIRSNIFLTKCLLKNPCNLMKDTIFCQYLDAYLDSAERLTRNYEKPKFNINKCMIGDREYFIEERVAESKPFCQLKHFSKVKCMERQPKLLIAAPMSGHHATLLRSTVEAMLPHFDVYITDWIDAAHVPTIYGKFDLDDYINYMIDFFSHCGEAMNVMAVCQPTVPVLAATAIISQYKNGVLPRSLILIGGPIDARKNPTVLENFAARHSLDWFKRFVLMEVPKNYSGAGRLVYPGFLQLSGFVNMNFGKHWDAHLQYFDDMCEGRYDKAAVHRKFYDEYLSVMDIPAEFYIQTIEEVFHKFSLAKGRMISDGKNVDLSEIQGVCLLGIEGEKDDIAAVGQTKAALDLCSGIPSEWKKYHLQKGVGHYGAFSGSKFKQFVAPVIRDFVYNFNPMI